MPSEGSPKKGIKKAKKIPAETYFKLEEIQEHLGKCNFNNSVLALRLIGKQYHVIQIDFDIETGLAKIVGDIPVGASVDVAMSVYETMQMRVQMGLPTNKELRKLNESIEPIKKGLK